MRIALFCAAIWQATASSPDLVHEPLSLRLSSRNVRAQPQRQVSELAAAGTSFRILGGIEDGGTAELLTIPKGATGEDVLMRVVVQVEKIGPREEDMWIRRVQIGGQWLKQKWAFKTGSGFYGSPENYLARIGNGEWKAPVDLLKASDGLLSLAIHNKEVPTQLFQSSAVQDVELVVGPVTIGVVYKTSNKDGINFNHLDVHLSGLSQVTQVMGGLLIGDAPAPAPAQDSNATETESPEDITEDVDHPSQLLQALKYDVSTDFESEITSEIDTM